MDVALDPEKINVLLAKAPIKVVEGSISEVKLSIDTKTSKAEVIIGKVSVIAYVDDHSQLKRGLDQDGNFVVSSTKQEATTLGGHSEIEDQSDGSVGFLESILTSFELGATIASLEVELRTERHVRSSSKFLLRVAKIDARKLKKKSDSTIHSINVCVGELDVRFQQIGEHVPKKLLAFQRLIRQGQPVLTKHVLNLSIDILKKAGSSTERKTVVRGNLASLQAIFTLVNAIDIFKVIDKAMLFNLRAMFMDQGLDEILSFYSNQRRDDQMHDTGSQAANKTKETLKMTSFTRSKARASSTVCTTASSSLGHPKATSLAGLIAV